MGNRPLRMKIRRCCTPRVSRPPPNRTQSWRPCFPGPPRDRGWRRAHLLVPSPRDEMIGSSARAVARDHALSWFLSSRKCTRSWWSCGRPLFTARSGSSASSILATLDGGAATGYVDIPQVESAVAVHLCLQNAATWRNCPRLPSKACKTDGRSRGQSLQCGGPSRLCAACQGYPASTPSQGIKCTRVVPTRGWSRNCAQRLTSPYGRGKSQRSPSGRRCPHLWSKSAVYGSALLRGAKLTKWAFSTLSSPRLDCSATLSRICRPRQHILPRHDAPLRRRARPSLLVAVGALLCPLELLRPVLNRRPAHRASRRSAAPPVFQLAPISSREAIKRPWHRQPGDVGSCLISGDGEDSATPSPEGGQGENHLFCSAAGSRTSGTHIVKERANSLSSEFSASRADSVRRTASSLSPATHLASGQESAVGGRQGLPRASSQSLQGLREFCEDESERSAFCTIQPYSHSLHHCGYVDCAVGATCTASGGVACAAQPVSLAHAHNSTRLRDSVRQATSQVQRRSRDCVGSSECSCLARGDCCPPGKDAIEPVPPAEMRQGFSALISSYPRKTVVFDQSWIATPEPGPAQAPV